MDLILIKILAVDEDYDDFKYGMNSLTSEKDTRKLYTLDYLPYNEAFLFITSTFYKAFVRLNKLL
jgi:hypothetical protein